jgi:RNA polymerase sigma-B factor
LSVRTLPTRSLPTRSRPDHFRPDRSFPERSLPERSRPGPVPSLRGTDPHTAELLTTLSTSPNPAHRDRARAELIERQLPFATFLARRFRNRGESLDDLQQVAALGLIKAIDGFDVERGDSFSSYAIPTILGELRRHFRDKGWAVRVPRPLQELRAEISATTERLTHDLGRAPTPRDLAEALEVPETDVRRAQTAAQAYSTDSLDASRNGDHDRLPLLELLPQGEPGYDLVEARECLRGVLGSLPERERRILGLRFYAQLTQSEIAAELGISQMHVSRLLQRSLEALRSRLQPTG